MLKSRTQQRPARKLTVRNFSVIKEADLEFGNITVIIGPQSSGKSLLCKLGFFSLDLLNLAQKALDNEKGYESFLQSASEEFTKLFPQQSWGTKGFKIRYEQGAFTVDIVRKAYKREPKDKAAITLPGWFADLYKKSQQRLVARKQTTKVNEPIYYYQQNRREFVHAVNARIGLERIANQVFVPAGRSFFTSVGKALAAFEEGGSIDPLTLRFGRQVRWDYDEFHYFARNKRALELLKKLRDESKVLLGGAVREERDKTVFVASDGRKLPLTNLSSGQQELLPLISTLMRTAVWDAWQMLYIEEPEAHLFPTAQASLVSLFALIAGESNPGISMVLTTHSPYILAKFNNLILAGQIGRKRNLRKMAEDTVNRQYWIKGDAFRAYSIENGRTSSILDENALIDGEYLDGVSEVIGNEWDKLLRLEYDTAK